MMVTGKTLEFPDGKVAIGKENYDLYFSALTVTGSWALRLGNVTKARVGTESPECLLHETDKFDQLVYMTLADESLMCLPEARRREKLGIDIRYFDALLPRGCCTSNASDRKLTVFFDIKSITHINQVEQKFDCIFDIRYEWLASGQDIHFHFSSVDLSHWKPEWSPEPPKLLNEVEVKDREVCPPCLMRRLDGKTSTYEFRASQTFKYNTTFNDRAELRNFPFDIQELAIEVAIQGTTFECDSKDNLKVLKNFTPRLAEWKVKGNAAWVAKVQSNDEEVEKANTLSVIIPVRRLYMVYVWRIVILMGLISASSLLITALHPVQGIGDRIGFLVTLLLTAVAYTIVISSFLPVLGYLTILDWYVIWVYAFLGSMLAVTSLGSKFGGQLYVTSVDSYVMIAFGTWWLVWHVGFTMWIALRTLPQEQGKLKKRSNLLGETRKS